MCDDTNEGMARWSALVRDIESRSGPLMPWPALDLRTAAVLLNQSGKAVLALACVWRYAAADGRTGTHRISNLGSSAQMSVLSGPRIATFPLTFSPPP